MWSVALALYVSWTLFLLGSPMTGSLALASPVPFPFPLPVPMMTSAMDYADSSRSANTTARSQNYPNSVASLHRTAPARSNQPVRRDIMNSNGGINILNTYYNQLIQHRDNFQSLASQAPSKAADDNAYNQQMANEVQGFHTSLVGLQSLSDLGSDKGLANYDKNDAIETLLKNVINTTKDFLNKVDVLVYEIPTLGPVLGPIVYQIKCIIDEILDFTENTTDAVLNGLSPLLKDVSDLASSIVGRSS